MNPAARWSLVLLVVVGALVVAIWPRSAPETPPPGAAQPPGALERRAADTPEALAGPRAAAALPACPVGATAPAQAPPGGPTLRGLTLGCLADGTPVPLAQALAGRPAVLNLWAHWCGPCAVELPALQEYARSVQGQVGVLTVHADPNEAAALLTLAKIGVQLPGVQDGAGTVAAAVAAPAVLPLTVVLHADGTVAKILPVPFTSAGQIAAAVDEALREGG